MSSFSPDFHFGPSSDLIVINDFAQRTRDVDIEHDALADLTAQWETLSQDEQERIDAELSMEDIQRPLLDAMADPPVYTYVQRVHEQNITVLASELPEWATSAKGKRRKFNANLPLVDSDDPDVQAFKKRVEIDSLRLLRLDANAALFLRRPRNSDMNTLTEIRPSRTNAAEAEPNNIVLIISVYARSASHPYGQHRISQHALLDTQTLEDLFRVMDCPFHRLTSDLLLLDGGDDEPDESSGTSECVMCIEGIAYGDGTSEEDYADQLLKHLGNMSDGEESPVLIKGNTSLRETKFNALSLRMHEPYYLLHQGSCEHHFVVDQIRLLHPADPRTGYPQTLASTPPRRDICRICSRMPASVSVVGDRRLAESPCLVCSSCWSKLGLPRGSDEQTFAVRLLCHFDRRLADKYLVDDVR